jgi:phage baseplate assembly protein W
MIESLIGGMPPVDITPGTVRAEVLQNVACILATRRGTVPYDRTLGLQQTWIDDPTPLAQGRAVADVIQSIKAREPRARVISVEFVPDTSAAMEGSLRPKVTLAINEGGA